MDIFLVVLQSVLVLLLIGVVGFWVVRRNAVPENALGFLSTIALEIALPCTVFASIIANFSPAEYPAWWQLPPLWLFFTAVALALSLSLRYIARRENRAEFGIGLFYQNGLFFPLIIISGVFGGDTPYLAQLFIFVAFHPMMFFSTYHLFFRKSGQAAPIRWRRVLNPVLIATAIAIALQLSGGGAYLPAFLTSIFQTLGAMAIPLVMIVLGGNLYLDFKQKGRIYYAEIAKFVLVKNIIFPLVFLGILLLVRPAYNIALLFIIQSAVPPITAIPIVTERMGGNKPMTTQLVLASSAFSVISIPAVFLIFGRFFPMP